MSSRLSETLKVSALVDCCIRSQYRGVLKDLETEHGGDPEAAHVDPAPPVSGFAEDEGGEAVHDGEVLVVDKGEVAPAVVNALHACA